MTMGKNSLESTYKWRKNNLRQIKFELNVNTDSDVLAYLESKPNKRAYLIELIRKDIANNETDVFLCEEERQTN